MIEKSSSKGFGNLRTFTKNWSLEYCSLGFIGFVKFEIKQWFSAYPDRLCVWFSLAWLRTALSHFLRKKRLYLSFSCLTMLLMPVQCLDHTFLYLSFAQSCKILSKCSKLSEILKHRGKNFVMLTSIVHLSFNRSCARTKQNARITWVII